MQFTQIGIIGLHGQIELEALPDDPGEVYGDSAFGGTRSANAIEARGGVPAIVATGTWGGPAALA